MRRGPLQLSAFSVIRRRVSLEVDGALIPGGETGFLSLEYFATREIGIFGSAFAGRGEMYADNLVVNRYVASAGFAWWIDRATSLSASYSLTVNDVPAQILDQAMYDYSQVAHRVSLSIRVRMP